MIVLICGKSVSFDDSDWTIFKSRHWHITTKGYVASGSTATGKMVLTLLHRLITEAPQGLVVDHIDGNPLNNCRCNLRICTQAENIRNRKIGSLNQSGFKGVTAKHRLSGTRYQAAIEYSGKRKFLGSFDSPEEAHAAYVNAALELHGSFARAA